MNAPDQPTPDPAKLDVMSCQQALRQIERMMEDGDLKDVERRLLFTHIRACGSCKQELQRSRNLELRLKDTFDALDTRSDFSDRILAALPDEDTRPEFRAAPSPSGSSNAPTRRYPATAARRAMPRWLWRWRVPLGVSALVCIGLLGARVRFGSLSFFGASSDADKAPLVIAHGPASLNNQSLAAEVERPWNPGETIRAQGAELTLTLSYNEAALATVILQPGAAMMADNRHSYRLLTGSAFFDVRKDRPHFDDEKFEVAADKFGVVHVTGTQFGIEVLLRGATVAVGEGRVEVTSGISKVAVNQGYQVALLSNRPLSQPVALDRVGELLARVPLVADINAPTNFVAQPNIAPSTQNVAAQLPQPVVEFNWEKPISTLPMALSGKTYSQGLEIVADAFGRPQPLLDLVQQARGPLIAKDATLSFSVHSSMSLREVLVWMARDVNARFELSPDGRAGRIRLALPDELPGETPKLDTALPRYVQQKLETRVDHQAKLVAAPGRMLPALLEEMSAACGMTIVADRSAWQAVSADRLDLNVAQGLPGLRRLDTLLSAGGLGAIWFDSVVYIAPAARIEALTMQPRASQPVAALVGNPMNHAWANELTRALDEFKFMPDKLPCLLPGVPSADRSSLVARPLIGSTAFYDISIDADGPEGARVLFKAGRLGEAWMNGVLQNLQSPAPPALGPSTTLSEPIALRNFSDLNALVELGKPAVQSRVRNRPFSNSAYVVKNMSIGKALEWGAWLQGLGVRTDNGTYSIEDAAACYGTPALQVLSLAPVLEIRRDLAPELPHAFAALLPQLYPAFFGNVEVRELSGRITFIGDKRQLELANELLTALQNELGAAVPGINFDVSTWRPVWRRELDRELAELFHGDADSLKRTFAGALRQSGLGMQLRHTIMVDPIAMKEHANEQVGEMDIAGMSVRRVLETLAGVAHLKMEVDGDVIWLKP